MKKILLFSDDEKLFEITKRITEEKYELLWNSYREISENNRRCYFMGLVFKIYESGWKKQ